MPDMKKRSLLTLGALFLLACSNNKKQETDLRNDILKVHDKVMANDETLMKNKMLLDSLLKLPAKDTSEKTNMKAEELKLAAAEEAMETWMQKFEPDLTGKSHDEILKYYNEQKKSIMAVDSQLSAAISESTKYLSNRPK